MAKKENKSGELTNEEIEKELQRKGVDEKTGQGYVGSQDTGDDKVRDFGSTTQQNDGLPADDDSTSK